MKAATKACSLGQADDRGTGGDSNHSVSEDSEDLQVQAMLISQIKKQ